MCQLCVDACMADRQEQGGTRGRENEGGGGRSGLPFRHPNKSRLFCSGWCSAYTEGDSSGNRNTVSNTLLQRCTGTSSAVKLLGKNPGSCILFAFIFSGCTTLWQRSSMTGRSAVCPNAARRARAGYATGEEVRSGRQWPGARSREVGWGAHMELCAAHGTDAKSMICASGKILGS